MPDIKDFHDACHGAFMGAIITPFNMAGVLAAARAGNTESAAILSALSGWITSAARAKRGEGALCLACDTEFVGMVPLVFAVAVPFASAGPVMVSGICKKCTTRARGKRKKLMALAIRAWRTVWPDAHMVEGGHA